MTDIVINVLKTDQGVRELTELDRRILAVLHLDGRAPWSAVARQAACSPNTAQRHFGALQQRGLVRVVGALDVLAARIGLPVLVRMSGAAARLEDFATRLRDRPEVRFLVTVAGTADCVAEVVVRDHADLQRLIPELLGDSGYVSEAVPVMRTFTSGHDWSPVVTTGPDGSQFDQARRPMPQEARGRQEPVSDPERRLVEALVRDGRTPLAGLAEAIGKSESTAARLLDGLQSSGLLAFRTLVEPSVLGYACECMVWVSVAPQTLEKAAMTLAQHPATKYLSATAGRYNLVGQVVLERYENLYDFATTVLGDLPGVRDVDLTLQMRTYKRVWTPVAGIRYIESPHVGELFGLEY